AAAGPARSAAPAPAADRAEDRKHACASIMNRMASEQFPRLSPAAARTVADLVRGCTFDDFLLTPQRSVVARRDPAAIDLSCRVSRRITLKRPIVSANMDTVTRAPMAIVQAEEGGLGVIDRGFRPGDISPQ